MSTNETNLAHQISKSSTADTRKASKPQACALCQQRKTKCDRKNPCSYCIKARTECIPASSLQPRPRKRRFAEAELLARLKRYETALKGCGVNIDELQHDPNGAGMRLGQNVQQNGEDVKSETMAKSKETDRWLDAKDEFRATEEFLQGSSDDEMSEGPITATYNDVYSNDAGDLLFTPINSDMRIEHPQPVQIFRLWQTFLDNVYPLTKVFHAPTVQQQIFEATADLEHIPESLEALLFGVYCSAVMSLDSADCESMFGEERDGLLAKYQSGAQQALLKVGFLRTSDIRVLQALALYLSTLQFRVDPRSLFCLTGISVRIAQRMGLHRDGTSQRLPPFEVEIRRRLWWQIILFDSRIAEFSGAGTSNLTHRWSTRLPLNINDGDLYHDMREPPTEHSGATEMVSYLTRCEIVEFLRKTRSTQGFDCNWYELSTPAISTSAKDQAINDLEALLTRKYFNFCKPEIPIQALTRAVTLSALNKMRLIVHHPRLLPDGGASMPSSEKDLLLTSALSQVTYYNEIYQNHGTKRFRWHLNVNAPIEAYMYLLSDLRVRPIGKLADEAWRQIQIYLDYRQHQTKDFIKRKSALYFALSNLLVKAWEAREAAMLDVSLEVPQFITLRRRELKGKKGKNGDPKPGGESPVHGFQFDTPSSLSSQVDTSNQLFADDSMDWSLWNDFMNENDLPDGGYNFP